MERLLAQTTVRVRAPAADRRSLPLLQHHGARPWYVLVPQTHSYSEVKKMFLEKQLDLEGDRMVTALSSRQRLRRPNMGVTMSLQTR